MSTEDRLIQQRLKKLEEIRTLKINPYPYKFEQKNHTKEILEKYKNLGKEEKTEDMVSIAGRIMSLREMGKASFGHIQDMSGKIQFYIREDEAGKKAYELFKKLDLGDMIGINGTVFRTKTGEISIRVKELVILAKSLRPLPEKFHGLKDTEIRYRKRYVDIIVNPEVKEVFTKRAKIYKTIREFLDSQGFIEVRTPILQTQYGGANARPFITKINAWDMDVYLRIAYELDLKRLIVGGFEKIYDLSSCFRNEDADRTHNPEFAMMEIQWAYADYHDAMKLTEELWEYVARETLGTTIIEYNGKKIDLKAPWKRLSIKQALKNLADIDVDNLKDNDLKKLMNKHQVEYEGNPTRGEMILLLFERLCEGKLIQPTHIIDHPKESCPLAKVHRDNPELIERIEPFINGWEVGNCYTELNDPILQRKLLEEQAKKGRGGDEKAHPMDEDFVQALEIGLPPNTGIGIGIDRMVMLLTGAESIRDVILFPTMRPENLEDKKIGKAKETKIAIAMINKSLKLKKWEELNTIAHLNAAFGARMGKQLLLQDKIKTKDDKEINLNIQHAIMIKEVDSNKELIKIIKQAREKELEVSEFTREMIETTDDRKVIAITQNKNLEDVEYLGALIFGNKSDVEKITKDLKLYQ